MYSTLFSKIQNLADISGSKEESWIALTFSGEYREQYSKTIFSELFQILEEMGKVGCVNYRIGKEGLSIEELMESLTEGVKWTVNINKLSFMGEAEEICNFFFDLEVFKKWADNSDPFSSSNPFNSHRCKIEVNGLPVSFGGPNFLISGNLGTFPNDSRLTYEHDRLKSVLRQFTEEKREIHPENHYVSFGDVDEYSLPFFRNSLKCFSVALCDELYEDKVVLRGIRRLEFGLQDSQYESVQVKQVQDDLCEAFGWVFIGDSRHELRHKLLMDRLTLDLPQNQSYFDGIIPLISHALKQAAERYNYAFFERSSEYQKELQQFLKELHGLCDSYSTKVRSLLGSFLRDALAGFLTVAITLFARVRDLEKLDTANVLKYVFTAYSLYLFVSCLFQVIVDWRDLCLSENEIEYWKTASRDYMSEQDFKAHKEATVEKRKKWAVRQYIYIALLYLAFALFSFHLPKLWDRLSESKETIQQSVEQNEAMMTTGYIITKDQLQNGEDTLSRDGDTTMCYTPRREQEL